MFQLDQKRLLFPLNILFTCSETYKRQKLAAGSQKGRKTCKNREKAKQSTTTEEYERFFISIKSYLKRGTIE